MRAFAKLVLIVCALAALGDLSLIASAGAASAGAHPHLRVSFPGQTRSGTSITVTGRVSGVHGHDRRVVLERRARARWKRAVRGRLSRSGTFRLKWRSPPSSQTIVLRVRVMAGHHTVAVSRSHPVRVRGAAPPTPVQGQSAPGTVVPPAGAVTPSLLAGGTAPPPSSTHPVPSPEPGDPPSGTDPGALVVDGTTAVVSPDRDTVLRDGAYSLRVSAGTVSRPTRASLVPSYDDGPVLEGPSLEAHIDGDWADGVKEVQVTLPLPGDLEGLGAGWTAAIVHDLSGTGDEQLLTGSALTMDAAAKTVTVSSKSLSRFHAITLPTLTIISAPSGDIRTGEWAVRLFRTFVGQRADQPSCSPAADRTRVSSTGSAFVPQVGRGNEAPILSCVQTSAGKAAWKLANNTGAVVHYDTDDDAQVDAVGTSSDPLTTAAYEVYNGTLFPMKGVDVPPGTSATVSIPEGSGGTVSFRASDPKLLPVTFALQQLGDLVPGESDAKKLYGLLSGCGWSLAIAMREQSLAKALTSLSNAVRCARSAADIAKLKFAKIITKPLLLINALIAEADTLAVELNPLEARLGFVGSDALGSTTPIDVRVLPGASWSFGLNDSAFLMATRSGAVLSATCTSTASVATDPLAILFASAGSAYWAAPWGSTTPPTGVPMRRSTVTTTPTCSC